MTPIWQPYREPMSMTVMRTVAIAVVVGAILALWRGGLGRWPLATLLVLWPSFGGHWVEIAFLNWLRPLLPAARPVQIAARLGVWFIGGSVLVFGMIVTATALTGIRLERWPAWWIGGVVFIGVELVAHLALQLRGKPSFYNGLG